MITITTIPLKDLLDFIHSEVFRQLENKPISMLRVQSYINNPNANQDDVVLYMAFKNSQLVGYRTIFKDVFCGKEAFGWLSGNWVHPKHRRNNISTLLFQAVLKDWQGRLMYSNYAEASKALYDKTDEFSVLQELHGFRYYRRMCLTDILPSKHQLFKLLKPMLVVSDWMTNLIVDLQFSKQKSKFNYNIIEHWNDELTLFLSHFKKHELFKRTPQTYAWISQFPWMQTDLKTKQWSKKYHFSSYAKVFQNNFYVLKDEQSKIIAIINISIRDQKLKVPYFYSLKQGVLPAKALILHLSKKHKINHLTIYHKELQFKNQFLFKKKFTQKFFVSKGITQKHTKLHLKIIQTGDGDGVFT